MAFITSGGSGTVNDGDITNAKLANMAAGTVKGRALGAGTGVPVDLTAAQQRAAAELGGAATLNVGTTAGTVAAGDDSRITGSAQKSSNLSDLASAETARANLKVAWEPLGTVTASGAAGIALDNIFNSTLYSSYVIEFELSNATNTATLAFELRDATPSSLVLTQTNTGYRIAYITTIFSQLFWNSSQISGGLSNGTVHCGRIMLWMPGNSINHRHEFSYASVNDGGTAFQLTGAGRITDSTPRQGIRFAMSSGNLTGTIRAWGIRVQP